MKAATRRPQSAGGYQGRGGGGGGYRGGYQGGYRGGYQGQGGQGGYQGRGGGQGGGRGGFQNQNRNQAAQYERGNNTGISFQQDEVKALGGDFSTVGSMKVRLDPSVVMTLLGAHSRISKNNKYNFVVGSLIGAPLDGVMHISDCFLDAIDQKAKTFAVDGASHKSFFDLKKPYLLPGSQYVGCMVSTMDVSILNVLQGWITNPKTTSKWNATKQLQQPIFLCADPDLSKNKLDVRVFQKSFSGCGFIEAPTVLFVQNTEKEAIRSLLRSMALQDARKADMEGSEDNNLRAIVKKPEQSTFKTTLLEYIDTMKLAQKHVQNVLQGKEPSKPAVVRDLINALSFDPLLEDVMSTSYYEQELKDKIAAVYVSKLTEIQFELHKLCKLNQLNVGNDK